MNANGVLGSMCFPSFPQFCGQLFARTEDKDVALAMLRAYNDWHIESMVRRRARAGSSPSRSRPSGTRTWPPRRSIGWRRWAATP